ncbi:MAG: cyclase family protein [Candidatus Izemoplasmatales bacterium]
MIYDISMTIHPKMAVYKNRPEKFPQITQVNFFEKEGHYETELKMNLHTGTHIDYPLHMLKDSFDSAIENLKALIGPAKVFDLTYVLDSIDLKDIENLNIQENDFILFKTKNSFTEEFKDNFIYLNESGANYLAKKKIRGVGIDTLGIERAQAGNPTHKILLGNKIIILEGLRLKEINEDEYMLYCLPIKIAKVEASPVRAILIK